MKKEEFEGWESLAGAIDLLETMGFEVEIKANARKILEKISSQRRINDEQIQDDIL
jgi:hypothetical protein